MLNIYRTMAAAGVALSLAACGGNSRQEEQEKESPARATVEVARGVAGHLERTASFPATTRYARKSTVTSPVAGFVAEAFVTSGTVVEAGQPLFRLESKERRAVGGEGDDGMVSVRAAYEGIVLSVSLNDGDYAAEGAGMCTIAETGSLVFDISVPFEQRGLARTGDRCTVELPDGERLRASVRSRQATIEAASQAERLTAVADCHAWLPEGLHAKAVFNIGRKDGKEGLIVPRGAVQSDEGMTARWVMRLGEGGKARRVAVEEVCHTASEIDVESDSLSADDLLIVSGGYGLEDGDDVVVRKGGER